MGNKFKTWWCKPPTKRDRAGAAVIGGIGMFWVALFLPAVFAIQGPFPLLSVAYWFIGFIFLGIILGIIFPKIISVVLFPLTLFGAS